VTLNAAVDPASTAFVAVTMTFVAANDVVCAIFTVTLVLVGFDRVIEPGTSLKSLFLIDQPLTATVPPLV
jgi:hypothetical protein